MIDKQSSAYYYEVKRRKTDSLFIYPLSIPKGTKALSNEFLFDLLFKFLFREIPVLMTTSAYVSAYNSLSYHYLVCTLPRFDFVKFTKEQYKNKVAEAGIPDGNEVIHRDVLRWISDHEQNSAIYEGTLRKVRKITQMDPERPDLPPGTWVSWTPEPENDLEAFQRLKFLTSQQVCEFLIKDFHRRYNNAEQRVYQAELDDINSFINHTDRLDARKALDRTDLDEYHEYLRLTNHYYLSHRCEYIIGGVASRVYGKYVWYKKWLEKKVRQLEETPKLLALPNLKPQFNESLAGVKEETFEMLFSRGTLSSFFKVASNSIEGSFWYDINDQQTSDSSKVVRLSHDSFQQTRDASNEDFPGLFDIYNITRKTSGRAFNYFLEDLIEYVQEMISNCRKLHRPHEKTLDHYELLELAADFINWLKEIPISGKKTANLPARDAKKPLMRILAMFHFFVNEPITRDNGDFIAKKYGHTSGEKLYARYNRISKKHNRTGPTESSEKDMERLKDFDIVIELLADHPEAKRRALAEKEEFSKVTTC